MSAATEGTRSTPWSRDLAISYFSRLLSLAPPETLDDLTRIFRNEAGRLAMLPIAKRRAFVLSVARSVLSIDLTIAVESAPETGRPVAPVEKPQPTLDDLGL